MLLYWAALALLAADQVSKYLVFNQLPVGETIPIVSHIFHLTAVRNTGIAFGLFQQHPGFLTALIGFCVILLCFFSYPMTRTHSLEKIAYGLILGGAIGNFVDRMRFGWVIDFLDFRVWPVFNLADSGITIGVILFAWKILFTHETPKTTSSH
jgi:signal peptidase II